MDYKIINFILMLVVFVGYVSFIWIKYGIQKSISASYYVLPKDSNFIFTLFCWGFAFPAIILGNTPLMFFAGAGIVFVGAAAAFREKMTYQVHMVGAFVGVILSQISIAVDFGMWWVNLAFVIPSMIILLLHKYIFSYYWWIELLAFGTICYVLGARCL